MRRHQRPGLPPRVVDALRQYQEELDAALASERRRRRPRSPAEVAEQAWNARRSNAALKAVARALTAAASDAMARCMYCEHDRGSQVDHHEPKRRRPDRTFDWDNLLWACGICNDEKTTRYEPGVIDPTRHDPLDHLFLSSVGTWCARSDDARGAATLRVLPINGRGLEPGRARAYAKLRAEVVALHEAPAAEFALREAALRDLVEHEPFGDAFAALLRQASEAEASAVFGAAIVDAVKAHPEWSSWLAAADDRRWKAAAPRVLELAARVRLPPR